MIRHERKTKPEPRPKTEDDLWLDVLREECARAMVRHIRASIDPNRTIRSLSLPELLKLAEACTAQWIVSVSKRHAAQPKTVPPKYVNLLFG